MRSLKLRKIVNTKLLGWVVIALVGYLFSRTLIGNWDEVQKINFRVGYQVSLVVALFASAVIISGVLWGKTFERIAGKKVLARDAIRIHLGAWLLKYVPGQVGALIYKIRWGTVVKGASKTVSAIAFAYEAMFVTLASTVVIIPILLLTLGNRGYSWLFLVYLLLVSSVFMFFGKYMNSLITKLVRKWAGKTIDSKYFLKRGEIAKFTALFSIARVVNATGFVVLVSAILPTPVSAYIPLGATYVLAGIVGLYAIFVPSGLGVREAVIVIFASTYFTPEQAIAVALIARMCSTVSDGLIGLLYIYLSKNKDRLQKL